MAKMGASGEKIVYFLIKLLRRKYKTSDASLLPVGLQERGWQRNACELTEVDTRNEGPVLCEVPIGDMHLRG